MAMHYINSDINHKTGSTKNHRYHISSPLSKGMQQRNIKTTENEMHWNEHRIAQEIQKQENNKVSVAKA